MADPNVIQGFRRASNRKAAGRKIQKALFAAGIVESNLTNPRGGDRDSVGSLQQRASQGWRGLTSPTHAAEEFIDHAKDVLAKNPGLTSGQLAQAVQRSAFPGRYSAHDVQQRAQQLAGGGGRAATAGERRQPTLSITGSVTPAHAVPSRAAAAEMVLRQGARAGLPDFRRSRLKEASQLFRTGLATETAPTTATETIKATSGKGGAPPTPRGSGQFKITGANPGRVKPSVTNFARKIAGLYGHPLTGDSGATHSKYTVNGNVSEHFTGNATDIPATGAKLIAIGRDALIAAGMPREQALKQTGGLFNVGRHQIIFNTHIGGDHTNHLHISTHAS